ncbi:hypothetical protein [uncultured Tyzzerella sp.]|uniref:hypothetical protein n=1 Tax=uncultured Tyzzerella sp. TaxID=2321398 RepID=UPI002942C233|nr:hypothetical protein [uncultured Tyzzerella sp.]
MKVKKHTLLLIASFIWLIAGFNVLRIGIVTYKDYISIFNIVLSLAVFSMFWFMVFSKLVFKHTKRINNFTEDLQFFLNVFDKKSFIIMACMITFGILIRILHLAPDVFIAVFYSGLGSALFLAGLLFGYNYFKTK